MLANLFGEFLVETGKVTKDNLTNILGLIGKNRVKLGLIAISEGILTAKQADDINRKQAVMDKRFGDIAIELGYLKSDQVSHLLDMQGNAYMMFCQAITDAGVLKIEEIDEAFAKMCEKYSIPEDKIADVKSDDIDAIVSVVMKDMSGDSLDLLSVAIRTINRLISTDISVTPSSVVNKYERSSMAYQTLAGDYNSVIGIGGDTDAMVLVAGIFAGEEFTELDMDSLDSLGEFLNIVNGLYATSLSYRRVDVELQAPVFTNDNVLVPLEDVYVVPVNVESKKLELIIKVQK